ncbi:MAG: alpha-L-fucosidase [Candidatus Omnitrophica bacterium]|nr:alpha-L-fucosidase [Candidatus Omnitrophota bacterium]
MQGEALNRRSFIQKTGGLALLTAGSASYVNAQEEQAAKEQTTAISEEKKGSQRQGSQRHSIERLKQWEALFYGMFIHFGMSTFVGDELPKGDESPNVYAPDRLDVDQWISVARDSGMRYAVLTTKHVAGHCLWPSKCTNHTVAFSLNQTDVVEEFVKACERRGVLPGFYYCSWDNHHKFGSQTPSDLNWTSAMNRFPREDEELAPFTTSLYQNFQTAQITELLTQYGSIAEIWIDIPGVLGRGYREYLYRHIAQLQPDAMIMMNSGIGSGEEYPVDYAWPSDLIAIERKLPPESGHQKWRTIEGKEYYMPGEICDPIGKEWFYVENDLPRSDEDLLNIYEIAKNRGVNLLLDVPPDRHGVMPRESVEALKRLRRNAKIG